MVIWRVMWAMLWFYSSLEAKAVLEMEPPSGLIETSSPFEVEVRLLRDPSETVDEQSFVLGGVKISPEKISEEKKLGQSESVYRLRFPGFPEGVQLLPELKVHVDGNEITAPPMTIQVGSSGNAGVNPAQPFLRLSIVFTGKDPMFPGQRAWIGYRIQFNRSIDLLEEKLPLLSPEGFKKWGEVQIRDRESGGVTTREILQRIEAVTPGAYAFEPSQIKGLVYTEGAGGTKNYLKPPLESQVSAVQMSVADFPTQDKPVSFTGAVGTFAIQAALAGPSTVSVGDPLKIKISVTGEEDLETLSLPDLCCQPGFSGQFRLSDLPPAVTIRQKTKTFAFDLFPLNGFLTKLPPIYFSSLDPKTMTYLVVQTHPIEIEVKEVLPELSKNPVTPAAGGEGQQWTIPSETPKVTLHSLILSWWDGWHLMLFVPLSLGVMWISLFPPPRKRKATAEALWKKACSFQKSERFFSLMAQSLQKAVEEGRIEDSDAYRVLKEKLEKRMYSEDKVLTADAALKEAEALWERE